MQELTARTVIDHLLFNPDGVAGKIEINLEEKPIVFHFEHKILYESIRYLRITRNGKMLFFSVSHPPLDNMVLLTEDERLLVAVLIVGILKVLEIYNAQKEHKSENLYDDEILAEVETDILPEHESDRIVIIALLKNSPVAVM